MLSDELKQKLETLPTQAGCYVMKDKAGEVVYVGKAVNLRARVGQYCQERSGDTRAFIPFLEDLLGDVEVMITPSEKDAVLLENELIKKYRPRFNVKLRDDKNFISLRLSATHPYPRLHRLGDGEPPEALPAVPDQALPRALRVQRAAGGVPALGGRSRALSGGEGRRADLAARGADEGRRGQARVRASRAAPRSAPRHRAQPGEAAD